MRALGKERERGGRRNDEEGKKEKEEIFRGRKQGITGHRRISRQPPWKNGILISILCDTGKNEESVGARTAREKSACQDPFRSEILPCANK